LTGGPEVDLSHDTREGVTSQQKEFQHVQHSQPVRRFVRFIVEQFVVLEFEQFVVFFIVEQFVVLEFEQLERE
jgi:hypothetical protein